MSATTAFCSSMDASELPTTGLLSSSERERGSDSIRRRSLKYSLREDQCASLALSVVLGLLLWIGAGILFAHNNRTQSRWTYGYLDSAVEDSVLVPAIHEALPPKPTPIASRDEGGLWRWTVWIPRHSRFPLKPLVQAKLCQDSERIAQHLDSLERNTSQSPGHVHHFPYYHVDPNFMDVHEAESFSFLPPSLSAPPESAVLPASNAYVTHSIAAPRICPRSLIYVLEATDPGLGPTLMALWAAHGLAARENRTFFIDDRRWAYGRWTDYFAPPPPAAGPSCAPPPNAYRVPCPRHAAHLLVSRATQARVFGHVFVEKFEDPRGVGVVRQRHIFALMRDGFEALFRLRPEDEAYVMERMREGLSDNEGRALTVGMHVRHGDRHPWEFAFQESYLPLQRYADAARQNIGKEAATRVLLASDDPAVFDAPEMAGMERAQDRYQLDGSLLTSANVNLTGGITASGFWAMGLDPEVKAQEALRLRMEIAKSYLLDLAVLGRADRVVCAVSSVACRLLAVMMGWEAAIEHGAWQSVDGDFDWTGVRW